MLPIVENVLASAPDRTLVDNLKGTIDTLDELQRSSLNGSGQRPKLYDWNEAAVDYPKHLCLQQLLELQVERTPDKPALAFEGQRMTYREFDRRANQLAHHLRELGVGPEVLVGLFIERSLNMMVAIFGILKTGGAYVPIDVTTPAQRIAFILTDAKIRVTVTQTGLVSAITHGAVLALDTFDWNRPADPPLHVPALHAGNLAYVIYTSGSTGSPKGVCVEHRSIVNYVLGVSERFQFRSGMNYALVSTIAADLGNTVVFPALATGGCLHIISTARAESQAALAEYFTRERIDVMKIVPSHLKALQAGRDAQRILPRQRLILGGEASRLEWIEQLRKMAPECEIHNHYGPTEATVGILTFPVSSSLPVTPTNSLPLGRPLPNCRVYILDENLQETPIGVTGELYVGGDCLARGYLNRGDRTAEQFITDPFSNRKGDRLYRTGDRVRLLPSGDIEFLGRLDHQVKIRGYRVELGEIEAALRGHAGVQEVVVMAAQNEKGEKQLVAYIVPKQRNQPLWAEKSAYLLPDNSVVAHLNRNETEYIYNEIFVSRAYLRNGVTIHDGDCIVDAGANIGMFTIFASRLAGDLKIYAFEPNPACFGCLTKNAAAWGDDVRCFPVGLSREETQAEMTVFDGMSLLSGFHADAETEREVVTKYTSNQRAASEDERFFSELGNLLDERFRASKRIARLRSLSSIIAEEGIGRIDLLKVNVEKSEVEILEGLGADDWPKIRQVVVEVDRRENLTPITAMLEEHGFRIVVEQDPLLKNTELCYVYAVRVSEHSGGSSNGRRDTSNARHLLPPGDRVLTPSLLRKALKERLPQYMIPHLFVLMDSLPLTPNGKVDRHALPQPKVDSGATADESFQPQTQTERELATLWKELLGIENVGVRDDFFDLGGHSLLAIKAASRIRDVFGVDMSAQALFVHHTIADLALFVSKSLGDVETAAARQIELRKDAGPAPLSFAQQPLWYMHQLNPDSPAYHIVDVIRLEGFFNREAMKKSLVELARRQEILRTSFIESHGHPVQTVSPELNLSVPELDLSSLSEEERERAWTDLVDKDGRGPFNLSQAPLWRASVAHFSRRDHRLLFTIHHILADEWSMEVIQRELRQLYVAFAQDMSSPLADLPIQYADFSCWQQETFRGEVLEEQLAYWRQELAGAPTVLALPTDKQRPASQSLRGATEFFTLPGELLNRLKDLSRQEQATIFMTLEASFAALLHRYTGQNVLLLGTPISSRTYSETENLIGCFLNILVLRTQFAENATFRSLLRQTRERVLGAFAHRQTPFDQLVAAVAPVRDASRSPLFQVMFVLHEPGASSQVSKASGNHRLQTGTSKFDLTLILSEGKDGLEAVIEYSTDLFTPESIRRMAGHYSTLLEALVRHPDEQIATLPMLPNAEQQQLLMEWNDTAAEYPRGTGLHQLLADQAERTPDEVALIFGRQSMTYSQLDHRANQLAHQLRRLGVGPGALVGLLIERSLEMMVGLLGILKAGGAYVPLDPAFPRNRLAFMVEDSRMKVLLTHRDLDRNFPVLPSVVVRLDSDWSEIARNSSLSAGLPNVSPGQLAYVLYTSGSTGKPKGVAIPHSAMVNFLVSMQRAPGFNAGDILLAVTTLSFDIAGLELYLPLLCGGKVVISAGADNRDPQRLIELIRQSACTVMQATPATFRALIHAGWGGEPGLKILCGGEPLLPDLAGDLLARCGELWNMYGPTETTVWSTIHRVRSVEGPVPIGKPINNTQVYVLDAHRNLLPAGATGELYIGGDGVAQVYLHREELTRERFVPNPFTQAGRMYRTGDLARWLPDGTLECLGRVDNQVKIRGFRIELGEIEAVLSSHPGIAHCAVIAREDTPGDKRLVAYIEPAADTAPDAEELRAYLEMELPSYMVPGIFVRLEKLPLTPNGKIDRKALPAPVEGLRVASNYVAPHDELEQLLAQVFARILRVSRVGAEDNFFDLGGHSLLAVRVIAEVEKLCHVRLPLATLFQSPTISDLARLLRRKNWRPSWSSLVPIRPSGTRPPLFLMHSHGGNTLEYHRLANLLDADQPVYALQARGLDGHIAADSTVEEMAAKYIEELKIIQPQGPYFLGGYCFGGLLALEAAQQLTATGEEVKLVVMIQTFHPQTISFRGDVSLFQRWWYRTTKRCSLELQNLSSRGLSFIGERLRFHWERTQVKAALALGRVRRDGNFDLSNMPMHFILEFLGSEHTKAAVRYLPRPYAGRVALIRAGRQLRGLVAGEHLGWNGILTGELDISEVPGHQQNMLHGPVVSLLARQVSHRLAAAQQQADDATPALAA